MNKYLLLLLFQILFISHSYAAHIQNPDSIIVGKDTFPLWCNPIESKLDFLSCRDSIYNHNIFYLVNQRRYVAIYELRNEELFLVKFNYAAPELHDSFVDYFNLKYPELQSGKGLKLDWFDGSLMFSTSDRMVTFYGYEHIHYLEVFVVFDKGKIEKIDTFNNSNSLMLNLLRSEEMLKSYVASYIDWSKIETSVNKKITVELWFFWNRFDKIETIKVGKDFTDDVVFIKLERHFEMVSINSSLTSNKYYTAFMRKFVSYDSKEIKEYKSKQR